MTTIALFPRLTTACDLCQATAHHHIASAAMTSSSAGLTMVAIVILIVASVAAAVKAASRMAALFAELLHLAATITSYVFAIAIAMLLVALTIIHR